MPDIALTEEFNGRHGTWTMYDPYGADVRQQVREQDHVDVRVFQQNPVLTAYTMADLSLELMSDIEGDTVGSLTTDHILYEGENWTSAGTVAVGSQADRNYTAGLSLTCPIGTTTTTSIASPVDLLTGVDPEALLSVALPAFPLANINAATSYIEFSIETNGSFVMWNRVPLSASTVALVAGDSEFRVRLSDYFPATEPRSRITGVRFTIVATGATTFRALAIRALDPLWSSVNLDADTRYGRLRRAPALNGALLNPSQFNLPVMWRSSDPPGVTTPRPIDADMSVVFSTGSRVNTNTITLYFREVTEDFLTQLDIDGFAQSTYDGNDQPDLGNARFNSRTQRDIEAYDQNALFGDLQYDIERSPDNFSASWIYFTFQFTAGSTVILIGNTEANAGTFVFPALAANKQYVFYTSLKENSARATIYEVLPTGVIGPLVYDTTQITDDDVFKRRRGRFGWFADLQDGDVYIDSVRERGLNYGEYRSLPFESITPIEGAQVFVTTSPKNEHVTEIFAGPYNLATSTSLTRDAQRSTSGLSYKVTNYGTRSLQGIRTNQFLLTDFANTEVNFDLYYPSSAVRAGQKLIATVYDETSGRQTQLLLPEITPDTWQPISIRFPFDQDLLTGSYSFSLIQDSPLEGTWWFDKLSISSRTVSWDARARINDPWNTQEQWIPFGDAINSGSNGVLFGDRSPKLQVRGRALRSSASISRIQFKPKYAELGRPQVLDAGYKEVHVSSPTANFTAATLDAPTHKVRFTSTSVPDMSFLFLSSWEWNFGDGSTGYDEIVDHTYAVAGVYSVSLMVKDSYGNPSVYRTNVAVP